MKKLATLALAMLVVPSANTFAAGENDQMIENQTKMEMTNEREDEKVSQTDFYEVTEVLEDTVTLKFVENLDGNTTSLNGAKFNVPKEKFAEKEVNVGDRYKISHDDVILESNPAQFGKIYSVEKEIGNETEAPDKDIKEDKITQDFVVEEVNDDGYIIYELKNKENKYLLSKKDAKNMDLGQWSTIEITHNGVIMESNPAQFNKIYDIKEHYYEGEDKNKDEKITEIFVVEEVNDGGYTISKEDDKDNKYSISKEDVKGTDLKIGDKLEITHTGLATRSIPAQFVGDFKINKLDNDKDKETPSADKKDTSNLKKDKKVTDDKKINSEKTNLTKKDSMTSLNNKIGGSNPKTGVLSSMSVLGTAGLASILAKKTKK